MTRPRIYLDHHATTPVDPRVLDVMLPHFTQGFGNPSSRSHAFGWEADRAVQIARGHVAVLVGASSPREIVFTSGATESNNLALVGTLTALAGEERDFRSLHAITSTIEHACVLEAARHLESLGASLTQVGVGPDGRVRPEDVEAAVRPETALISVMAVNNEVGTIQPLREIGAIAKRHGILFHTDAAQAAGRIDIDVERDHIDLLSLSAHKLYGPKGVGALYVRRLPKAVEVQPQQRGGGQEGGLRSGTLNVPGIVGLGEAARLALEDWESDAARVREMRDVLFATLSRELPGLRIHGTLEERVPGNLSFSIDGVEGEQLLANLDDVALSAGSACASAKVEVSHVLTAMDVPRELARNAVRVGLGRTTTPDEVAHAAKRIVEVARRLEGAPAPGCRLGGGSPSVAARSAEQLQGAGTASV